MTEARFQRSVDVPVPAREAFEWHLRPGALRRLMPPWERAEIVSGSGPNDVLEKGSRTRIRVRVGPMTTTWDAEISDIQPERTFFIDRQLTGPFERWVHRHEVSKRGTAESTLTDRIDYRMPLGPLGRAVGGGHVKRKLERVFAWRHRIFVNDLALHAAAKEAGTPALTVAVTGASGLVGAPLCAMLRTGGHRVLELVRREARAEHEVQWDPLGGTVDTAKLEGIDAVVHLAGENIFGLRWTAAKKERIRRSRVEGTRTLVAALNGMSRPPSTLVCATAVGYYGDRGDEELGEDAALGTGFLAETCDAWEREVRAIRDDVREVRLRLGVVVDAAGGALAKMMPAFKFGVGGPLGRGEHWFPWVALDDVVGAFHHALWNGELSGPVNVVAPGAARQVEFSRALGKALGRPSFLPLPKFALRAVLGAEQADEMLLSSARVVPSRLREAGYTFLFPEAEAALKHTSGKAV